MIPHEIVPCSGRTARARFEGETLRIALPSHWPEHDKQRVVRSFLRRAARLRAEQEALPAPEAGLRERWDAAEFDAYVRALNAETLRAPLAGVRVGEARKTRLAQCNPRTRVLTFSRFAIDGMPAQALRYLALHELAHLFEANHSPRFWAHVARFEPDYRHWRRVAQAHFARQTAEPPPATPVSPVAPPPPLPRFEPPAPPRAAAERPTPLPPAGPRGPTPPTGSGLPLTPFPTAPRGPVPLPPAGSPAPSAAVLPASPAAAPIAPAPDAHPFGPLFAFWTPRPGGL